MILQNKLHKIIIELLIKHYQTIVSDRFTYNYVVKEYNCK